MDGECKLIKSERSSDTEKFVVASTLVACIDKRRFGLFMKVKNITIMHAIPNSHRRRRDATEQFSRVASGGVNGA